MPSTLPPPALPVEVLVEFMRGRFGIAGKWTPLEGERDQNYQVTEAGGEAWVFKVCNPDEGDAIATCQAAALEHIAHVDPALPVPRVRHTLAGERLAVLSHDGQDYRVMVLSYLSGEVIGETGLQPRQLHEMGQLLARLGISLRGFIDPAPASRDLVWDTWKASNLSVQVPKLPPGDQLLAAEILVHHRDVTVPALAGMRCQTIHGDVHPFNSLVDETGAISGIIDFGDLVQGALVLDLSNALADFLTPGKDNAAIIFELVRGYAAMTRLEEIEADAILDLVEVRLLMTPLIDSMKADSGIAPQDYFTAFNGRCMPMIRELRQHGRETLQNLIRRAAGYPPKATVAGDSVAEMVARRRKVMGGKLYVFYDPPVHMVKGEGVWLTGADGRRYLDCYNNVPHVGHCHPYVTEAIIRQVRRLNTNTRYLTDESIGYAERLAALCDDSLTSVVFVNSGSEANDLAWRMAKAWTGKTGGLAMEFAYHGITEATDAFSPSNAPATWVAPHMRLLPPPDEYRGLWNGANAGQRYAALADPLIAELNGAGHGLAATMIDQAFMTNGILDAPEGYVQAILERTHAAGGLFIADEVQSGFGRMGTAFWGHQHHGVVPDFITIGKPAGNGHPVGAVITRPEILDHFTDSGPLFSTFGGNNVACAAGIAVLDVIRDEGLVENSRIVGDRLRTGLRALMAKHELIGDVRGMGLATGLELVRDRKTLDPAGTETARLLGLLRDEGVLIGGEGKFGNVLKIRPPLVFQPEHADFAIAAIDRALARL